MLMMTTHRPRNVNASRAAGILYGDWGTSKVYVIGLAFALGGYSSFWPVLAVSILSLFVGLNYIIICKYYPNGGGVYASVRRRSKWLAFAGAFFLVADYLVTAALSALSAFNYFGVSHPALYSAFFILLIGLFNYYGPRHTGTFALWIAILAVAVFTELACLSLPFLHEGWKNLQPPSSNPLTFWTSFCSVIVALSGVETIANTTSVMRLNRGSTEENPVVTHTSTPAILFVLGEVILFTTLFSLAAAAVPHFQIHNQTVSAPGFPEVNDYMLSYLAKFFGTKLGGPGWGDLCMHIIQAVAGLILLSAVNTAINGLISLQYLMASDEELPRVFRKTNSFGVPLIPLFCATILPALLILIFKKVVLLADLYAIGFVGAIATNLGATSTDKKLPLITRERVLMFSVFIIMALIEITLFIQKSHARYFAIGVLGIGMLLRWIALQKKKTPTPAPTQEDQQEVRPGATLCIVRKLGQAVYTAIDESNRTKRPLELVFIRDLKVISEKDLQRSAAQDPIAKRVFAYVTTHGDPNLVRLHYSITDSFAHIAAAYALRFESKEMVVDTPFPRQVSVLTGLYEKHLRKHLPPQIELTVVPNKK